MSTVASQDTPTINHLSLMSPEIEWFGVTANRCQLSQPSSNLTLPLLLHFVFLILIRQCLLSFSHSVSISLTVSDLKSISFHLTYYNSICLPSLSSFLTRRLRGKRKKAAGILRFLIGTLKGFLREKFGLNSCSETGAECMLLNLKQSLARQRCLSKETNKKQL